MAREDMFGDKSAWDTMETTVNPLFKAYPFEYSYGTQFDQLSFEAAYNHSCYANVDCHPWDEKRLHGLDKYETVISATRVKDKGYSTFIMRFEGAYAKLEFENNGKRLGISVSAADAARAKELAREFRDRFKMETPPENTVKMTFWAAGPQGPQHHSRKLKCPEWADIERNYSADVQEKLNKIVGTKPDRDSGLILWNGDPGTGKTTALRAMARSWDEWASINVITDPERLLNEGAYLNSVAINGYDDKPMLIIMEDAGELIAADARVRSGQALSRLLNITDGLLGQGRELYVLITTNEPLGKLHEAVQRPGRCISYIEFTDLSADEANKWLVAHDLEPDATGRMNLSHLYARLEGMDVFKKASKLGFAAG